MSSITVYIKNAEVRDRGNFFIVAQLDETEYPDKVKSTQKFRTDLCADTAYLRFNKNIFKFEQVSLGNRLLVKFGCFMANASVDVGDTASLLVSLMFTKEKFSSLRIWLLCDDLEFHNDDAKAWNSGERHEALWCRWCVRNGTYCFDFQTKDSKLWGLGLRRCAWNWKILLWSLQHGLSWDIEGKFRSDYRIWWKFSRWWRRSMTRCTTRLIS